MTGKSTTSPTAVLREEDWKAAHILTRHHVSSPEWFSLESVRLNRAGWPLVCSCQLPGLHLSPAKQLEGKTTALYILHYSRKMVNEAPEP